MNNSYYLCSLGAMNALDVEGKSALLPRIESQVGIVYSNIYTIKRIYNALPDEKRAYFWAQEITDGHVNIVNFYKNLKEGFDFFNWIEKELGYLKPQNQAVVINRVCEQLLMNPIDLFNKLAENLN